MIKEQGIFVPEETYRKIFTAVAYLIFNRKFEDFLESTSFVQEKIDNIIEEAEKFNGINRPKDSTAKDRDYAFNHPACSLAKYLLLTDPWLKTVFFNKTMNRKGNSFDSQSRRSLPIEQIENFKEMLLSYLEKVDLSPIFEEEPS